MYVIFVRARTVRFRTVVKMFKSSKKLFVVATVFARVSGIQSESETTDKQKNAGTFFQNFFKNDVQRPTDTEGVQDGSRITLRKNVEVERKSKEKLQAENRLLKKQLEVKNRAQKQMKKSYKKKLKAATQQMQLSDDSAQNIIKKDSPKVLRKNVEDERQANEKLKEENQLLKNMIDLRRSNEQLQEQNQLLKKQLELSTMQNEQKSFEADSSQDESSSTSLSSTTCTTTDCYSSADSNASAFHTTTDCYSSGGSVASPFSPFQSDSEDTEITDATTNPKLTPGDEKDAGVSKRMFFKGKIAVRSFPQVLYSLMDDTKSTDAAVHESHSNEVSVDNKTEDVTNTTSSEKTKETLVQEVNTAQPVNVAAQDFHYYTDKGSQLEPLQEDEQYVIVNITKNEIGEKIFPKIEAIHPHLAAKITGMILENDVDMLVPLLDDDQCLFEKVDQAVGVLVREKFPINFQHSGTQHFAEDKDEKLGKKNVSLNDLAQVARQENITVKTCKKDDTKPEQGDAMSTTSSQTKESKKADGCPSKAVSPAKRSQVLDEVLTGANVAEQIKQNDSTIKGCPKSKDVKLETKNVSAKVVKKDITVTTGQNGQEIVKLVGLVDGRFPWSVLNGMRAVVLREVRGKLQVVVSEDQLFELQQSQDEVCNELHRYLSSRDFSFKVKRKEVEPVSEKKKENSNKTKSEKKSEPLVKDMDDNAQLVKTKSIVKGSSKPVNKKLKEETGAPKSKIKKKTTTIDKNDFDDPRITHSAGQVAGVIVEESTKSAEEDATKSKNKKRTTTIDKSDFGDPRITHAQGRVAGVIIEENTKNVEPQVVEDAPEECDSKEVHAVVAETSQDDESTLKQESTTKTSKKKKKKKLKGRKVQMAATSDVEDVNEFLEMEMKKVADERKQLEKDQVHTARASKKSAKPKKMLSEMPTENIETKFGVFQDIVSTSRQLEKDQVDTARVSKKSAKPKKMLSEMPTENVETKFGVFQDIVSTSRDYVEKEGLHTRHNSNHKDPIPTENTKSIKPQAMDIDMDAMLKNIEAACNEDRQKQLQEISRTNNVSIGRRMATQVLDCCIEGVKYSALLWAHFIVLVTLFVILTYVLQA